MGRIVPQPLLPTERARFLAWWRNRYGNLCVGWRRPRHYTKRLTVDHILPLSQGGTHAWSNLRGMCWWCNNRRQNKPDFHDPSPKHRHPLV